MKKLDRITALFVATAAIGLHAAPALAKAPPPTPTGPGSLNGVWFGLGFSAVRINPDVRAAARKPRPLPPYAPWALAINQQHAKDSDNGMPYNPLGSKCLPEGMPAMMFPPNLAPIEFLETPGQIVVIFEEFNSFRHIYLNVPHQTDPDPTFFGDAVGHWEGDTLVVDTVAIDTVTPIESDIYPHSDALHTVERIRRTGPDSLEDSMTIEDPKALTKPYVRVSELKRVPGQRIQEDHCTNNRNPSDAAGHMGATVQTTP